MAAKWEYCALNVSGVAPDDNQFLAFIFRANNIAVLLKFSSITTALADLGADGWELTMETTLLNFQMPYPQIANTGPFMVFKRPLES